MSYKNVLPANATSFDPFSAGVLSSQNVQGALDEIASRLPPPPSDCSSFSGQSAALADTIGNGVSAASLSEMGMLKRVRNSFNSSSFNFFCWWEIFLPSPLSPKP